jgi:hypothetical protein
VRSPWAGTVAMIDLRLPTGSPTTSTTRLPPTPPPPPRPPLRPSVRHRIHREVARPARRSVDAAPVGRGPARPRRSERRFCRRGCACPAPLAPPACRRARSFRGRFDGLVTCAGAPKQLDGESSTAHRLGRDKRASAIQANKARPQSEAKEPLAPARGRRPSSTSAGRTLFRDSAPR